MCQMYWLGDILSNVYSPIIEIVVTGLLTLIVTTISICVGNVLKECLKYIPYKI